MKQTLIYTILLWSIASFGYAQQKSVDLSKMITVGKHLPPIPRQSVLFYNQNKIDLHNYTDKVLILDFFDTYCSNCIASLPKLQKLQDDMADKLQIVMVTWQDSETIEKFWSTNRFIKENNIHLPIIYNDSLLRGYFPHQVIPHVTWLYQENVQAITHSDFVTADRIDELYIHGRITIPLKHDFEDKLMQSQSIQNLKGSVLLTGFQEGRPTETYTYGLDSLTGMYKTSFYNMPILGAYTATWGKVRKPTFLLKPERIIWNVKDSSLFDYFTSDLQMQVWISENAICYERFDTIKRNALHQASIILDDLNTFLGLNVYWATRKIKCLVLRGDFMEAGMQTGQRINSTDLLAFQLDLLGKYPPTIDQVKVEKTMYIPPFENLVELNQHLNAYGLFLTEEIQDTEVLIVEERY